MTFKFRMEVYLSQASGWLVLVLPSLNEDLVSDLNIMYMRCVVTSKVYTIHDNEKDGDTQCILVKRTNVCKE